MTDIGPALLGLAVLAAAALLAGGVWALRQPGANRTKAWLMIGAAAVTLVNVWINAGLPGHPAAP